MIGELAAPGFEKPMRAGLSWRALYSCPSPWPNGTARKPRISVTMNPSLLGFTRESVGAFRQPVKADNDRRNPVAFWSGR
jgi:hypothetical protein